MSKMKGRLLSILTQRSTMVGIVGLVTGILSTFGIEMDAQQQLALTEAMLVVVSVTAIAVQPKTKEDAVLTEKARSIVRAEMEIQENLLKEKQEEVT